MYINLIANKGATTISTSSATIKDLVNQGIDIIGETHKPI